MIAEVSHPAVIWRSRACPAIVGPGTPLDPGRRAAAHPPGPSPSAATGPASLTGSCSTSSSRCWSSAAATAASPTHLLGDHLRRRRDEWISAGVAERLRLEVLAAYDQLFGLELEHLAVDGCTTKAPRGGQTAGPSPVDRGKQGWKRSVAVEAGGIPLAALPAPANQRDDGLLAATLDALEVVGPLPAQPVVDLDAGYDYQPCRQILTGMAWPARSPPAGRQPRSRRAAAG
jgi:hypothetical protein